MELIRDPVAVPCILLVCALLLLSHQPLQQSLQCALGMFFALWVRSAGPLVHAVVWQNTEKEWLVALDTSDMFEEGSSDGALADFEPLGEFHLNQDYRTLSKEDACNFGVHVYNDGDVLSIFVGAGMSSSPI